MSGGILYDKLQRNPDWSPADEFEAMQLVEEMIDATNGDGPPSVRLRYDIEALTSLAKRAGDEWPWRTHVDRLEEALRKLDRDFKALQFDFSTTREQLRVAGQASQEGDGRSVVNLIRTIIKKIYLEGSQKYRPIESLSVTCEKCGYRASAYGPPTHRPASLHASCTRSARCV